MKSYVSGLVINDCRDHLTFHCQQFTYGSEQNVLAANMWRIVVTLLLCFMSKHLQK